MMLVMIRAPFGVAVLSLLLLLGMAENVITTTSSPTLPREAVFIAQTSAHFPQSVHLEQWTNSGCQHRFDTHMQSSTTNSAAAVQFTWRDNVAAEQYPTDFFLLTASSGSPVTPQQLQECLADSTAAGKAATGSIWAVTTVFPNAATTMGLRSTSHALNYTAAAGSRRRTKQQQQQQQRPHRAMPKPAVRSGWVGVDTGATAGFTGGRRTFAFGADDDEEDAFDVVSGTRRALQQLDGSSKVSSSVAWQGGGDAFVPHSITATIDHELGLLSPPPPPAPPKPTTPNEADAEPDVGVSARPTQPPPPPRRRHTFASQLRGKHVKVAVFDTGLAADHPDLRMSVRQRIDWTRGDPAGENDPSDKVGHGTFVASVIAGRNKNCRGVAPDAELYIYKVFTSQQVSYTSWFLDAFNYALHTGIDVLNLSIGGPDHGDRPFVDKIQELAASGMVVVSAIGNDGVLWGSANNPADMASVLGVGGYDNSHDFPGVIASKGEGKDHTGDKYKLRADHPEMAPDEPVLPGIEGVDMKRRGGVAAFSSRGMTTWDIGAGMGLVKPDVIAASVDLVGSTASAHGEFTCRKLTGTSVAAPVVAGAVAALLSSRDGQTATVRPLLGKSQFRNIAAVKQIILESSTAIKTNSIFEAGSGLLDLGKAAAVASAFVPQLTLFPNFISNFPNRCPSMAPYCTQRLFHSSAPLIFNLTLLNSISVRSRVVAVQWIESAHRRRDGEIIEFASGLQFVPPHDPTDPATYSTTTFSITGGVLDVKFQFPSTVFPWSGFLAVGCSVPDRSKRFVGYVSVKLKVYVLPAATASTAAATAGGRTSSESDSGNSDGGGGSLSSVADSSPTLTEFAQFEADIGITPVPPRSKRVLWDVYHSISYPSAYVPRDNLGNKRYQLDWLGDHPYTNHRMLHQLLLSAGYTVELLRSPWTCFDASLYGTLLVLDPEEGLRDAEVDKLEKDMREKQLSVVMLADWHDATELLGQQFRDDNTHSRWYPVVGGSNVPALNLLLNRFGASLGLHAFEGSYFLNEDKVEFQSGNTIARWPAGGVVLEPTAGRITPTVKTSLRADTAKSQVIGAGATVSAATVNSKGGKGVGDGSVSHGRLVVYGDSDCWDMMSHIQAAQEAEREEEEEALEPPSAEGEEEGQGEGGVQRRGHHGPSRTSEALGDTWDGCAQLFRGFMRYVDTGIIPPGSGALNPENRYEVWPNVRKLQEEHVDTALMQPLGATADEALRTKVQEDEEQRADEFTRVSKAAAVTRHLGTCDEACVCAAAF